MSRAVERVEVDPDRLAWGTWDHELAKKVADGEAARGDPDGFYHGMRVQRGGEELVLSGPPIELVPGESRQGELFAASRPGRAR